MKGDIRLRATCLLPERLLNRALEAGASFRVVKMPDARTLLLDTDAAGARTFLALCQRYSIPASVVSRSGASAMADFVKRRGTLAIGLLVGIALCALFLSRLWLFDIAFTGDAASAEDPALFRRAMDDMGLRPGCPRPSDTSLLARQLEASADGYSFVGVRVQGIRLLVEAAPEVPSPGVYDVDAPRDLVSRCEGIVVSAEARSGVLCVSPGDTVRRGQLLIRGEEKASAESMRPIAALGEVNVRTWYTGQAELPVSQTTTVETGRTASRSWLRIAGWQLPLSQCESFDSQRETVRVLPIGGLFLPVEIVRTALAETRQTSVESDPALTRERLALLAQADAALNLAVSGLREYAVSRTWVDMDPPEGGMRRARAVYEIITNAAVTREALLQGG